METIAGDGVFFSTTRRGTHMAATISENALKILKDRYLVNGESVEGMFRRVSNSQDRYYNILTSLRFLPNSPTLFNAGLNNGCTLSACFTFCVEDSMLDSPSSIVNTRAKAIAVAKAGGGVGYYLGDIRPKGSTIKSVHRKACGPVAVLKDYQAISALITQGGKRDLAQMAVLPVSHPDIKDFIHVKDQDPQGLGSFNISVSWPDKWVEEATTHDAPSQLWEEQVESAWSHGCPGMFFVDTVNKSNPNPHLGLWLTPNPCGEVPGRNAESCNLGSLSLPRYFNPGSRDVNWNLLEEDVIIATQFLDDILDRNVFPHPDITKAAQLTRKLGLGVMGWADLLALMHIHYDTQKAIDLAKSIMKLINDVALQTSRDMAQTKGPYKGYSDKTEGPCARNETRTSIAPTGTIAIIADVFGGIEPHFSLDLERTTKEGHKLQEKWDRYEGFVPKTASEVLPEWHVKHQAAFQEYTNLAVSKCVVGDTMILTGEGWREIKDLHPEDGNDITRPMNIPVCGENGMTMTSHFYSGGTRDTLRVKTKQGSEIEGTPNHPIRVESPNGELVWRRLDELKPNDFIAIKLGQKVFSDRELISPDLACLLGHIIADGCIQNNWVVMFHTKEEVNNERLRLFQIPEIRNLVVLERNTRNTKRLPTIKPDRIKTNKVMKVQQNSRGVVKWLENHLGLKRKARNKSIPDAVLLSNEKVQRSFLRGLFCDHGIANTKSPNLKFGSASKNLARQVRAVLMNMGMYSTYSIHVVNGIEYYQVRLGAKEATTFVNEIGLIEKESIGMFEAWRYRKTSNSRHLEGNLPRLRDGYRVEKVKSITPGKGKVYDVCIPDGIHAFITEGIVSHNTINLPNTATKEDVSRIYRIMHDSGCKGGTIFRDGCRNEQVLVKKDSTTKSVFSTGIKRNLPNTRESKIHKFRVGGVTGFLSVGLYPNGKVGEIFLTYSKMGSSTLGMLNAWAITCSVALQHGTPLEELCEHHIGTRFEPCGLTDDKDVPICTSVPDYVCRWLLKHFSNEKETKKGSGQLCPDCGGELTYQSGCLVCPTSGCGWTRCS